MEEKEKILTLPNTFTFLRIAGTLCLAFLKPFKLAFLLVYVFSGVTDVLDGVVARTTNSTSTLGRTLDSVADLFFYAVMLFKLLPVMWEILPIWIWVAVSLIILTRIVSYSLAFIKTGRFSAVHNVMNKISGVFVFLIPFFILFGEIFTYYAFFVCLVTATASVNELFIHIKR